MNRRAKLTSSVRGRTTIFVALLFAITLVVSGFALHSILRRTMIDNVDTSLELRAADLGALAVSGVAPRDITIPDDGTSFAQMILDGEVIASSTNVRGQPPIDMVTDTSQITVRQTSGDAEDFRILVTEQGTRAGPVTIAVGTTLADLERTLRVTVWALLISGAALTALAGAATWVVVGRALRPVDSMRAEVAEISVTDLDRRVSQPTTDDEIRMLADTMNEMLGRLEAGTRAQRDFVSAASHELRTPIAVVRHALDVARAAESPNWNDVSTNVLEENDRMERLVDDLLVIARTDGGTEGRDAWTLVDLDDIALDEVGRLPTTTTIDLAEVSAGQVRGDPEQLRRVVRNLLDNAQRHAETAVAIEVASSDGVVVMAIDDDGPGIAAADRDRVFERFVRLDDSRSRRDGGFGLGLSIVGDLVRRHDGTVSVSTSRRLGGARITVTLPDARHDATD
ncbi:sensor histidine kinase [Ilumatobacter nonamiensis]|uniref:sensor histidine kinase n=1 Tax=Ilumatobacter nonamiensis TaxID=467093 RepID=UPI0003493731|nr:HAMP domain-containing sensor histidine kinase [Ilumatobacter nonamiensis]